MTDFVRSMGVSPMHSFLKTQEAWARRPCYVFAISAMMLITSLGSRKALAQESQKSDRPNIVFVITDDQRWDCLSIMGHPFLKTPNIDRIGREGAVFKNFFVTLPLCSPSRASILTGQYAHKNGVVDNRDHSALSHQLVTFPMRLQKAGYETAIFGKWHMGVDASPRPGFDRWCVCPGQGRYEDPIFNEDGKRIVKPGYFTDLVSDMAVDFIKAKRDKPFMLYVGHKAVHTPPAPAERHKDLYKDERLPTVESFWDDMSGKPALTRPLTQEMEKGHPAFGCTDAFIRGQMRCIAAVDEGVGRMIKTLEETGQLDNTVFVFTSDNGFLWNEHHLGDKRCAYEESIRVPFLVRYPKRVKPGTVLEQLALNIDVAPTFLELAGVEIPSDVQGKSLVPMLADSSTKGRESMLLQYFYEPRYENVPGWHAVRTERFKYIEYEKFPGMEEMYDLVSDPHEMKNLVKDPGEAEQVKKMKKELGRLKDEFK
jgi:N-acetylglucosamine-6-sulfatase